MHYSIWLLNWILATTFAQMQFYVPNPNVADLTERWTVGDTINISWKAGGDLMERSDLWITWFRSDAYYQLLKGRLQRCRTWDMGLELGSNCFHSQRCVQRKRKPVVESKHQQLCCKNRSSVRHPLEATVRPTGVYKHTKTIFMSRLHTTTRR